MFVGPWKSSVSFKVLFSNKDFSPFEQVLTRHSFSLLIMSVLSQSHGFGVVCLVSAFGVGLSAIVSGLRLQIASYISVGIYSMSLAFLMLWVLMPTHNIHLLHQPLRRYAEAVGQAVKSLPFLNGGVCILGPPLCHISLGALVLHFGLAGLLSGLANWIRGVFFIVLNIKTGTLQAVYGSDFPEEV